MQTQQQINSTKATYEIFLTEKLLKTEQAVQKFNDVSLDNFIKNNISLIKDDVIDIVKKKWRETIVYKKSHKLETLYVDSKGNLPIEFEMRLSAIISYGAEMGIELDYELELEETYNKILWVVNPNYDKEMVKNWDYNTKMLWLRTKEEITEEKEEKQEILTKENEKTGDNKIMFQAFSKVAG